MVKYILTFEAHLVHLKRDSGYFKLKFIFHYRPHNQAKPQSQAETNIKPKSSQDQAKPISSQAKASQASKIFGMTKPSQAKAYKIGWLWPGLIRMINHIICLHARALH